MIGRVTLPAMLALAATGLRAEPEPLPDFQTCMDIFVDQYEHRLTVNRGIDIDAVMGGLWDVTGVDYCGGVGVVNCDRSGDTIPCQRDLAAEQDAMTDAVRGDLPEPETLEGDATTWPRELYAQTYALAGGTSAGPDCDGMPDLMAAWCGANEANNRLQIAVLAWEIARWLDVAPPALESGWANRPPAVRPKPRPVR